MMQQCSCPKRRAASHERHKGDCAMVGRHAGSGKQCKPTSWHVAFWQLRALVTPLHLSLAARRLLSEVTDKRVFFWAPPPQSTHAQISQTYPKDIHFRQSCPKDPNKYPGYPGLAIGVGGYVPFFLPKCPKKMSRDIQILHPNVP